MAAPLKMDSQGIGRTTHWGAFELGGEVDWQGLLPMFGADQAQVDLPEETLEFPSLGLLRTEERLRAWGLL